MPGLWRVIDAWRDSLDSAEIVAKVQASAPGGSLAEAAPRPQEST
jgi:hypothetical protein